MWQAPVGANDTADLRAMLAAQAAKLTDANLRLIAVTKELEYLNGVVYELWRDVEGDRRP